MILALSIAITKISMTTVIRAEPLIGECVNLDKFMGLFAGRNGVVKATAGKHADRTHAGDELDVDGDASRRRARRRREGGKYGVTVGGRRYDASQTAGID